MFIPSVEPRPFLLQPLFPAPGLFPVKRGLAVSLIIWTEWPVDSSGIAPIIDNSVIAAAPYHLLLTTLLPALLLFFAVLVPLLPNPIHALLALLGLFGTTTVLFLSHGAEYIALVFLIVYVGALAILFLFVIMLLNVKEIMVSQKHGVATPLQLVSASAGILLFLRLLSILQREFESHLLASALQTLPQGGGVGEVMVTDVRLLIGLYGEQWPLFLLITVVLLLAMLGAIVLAVGDQGEE